MGDAEGKLARLEQLVFGPSTEDPYMEAVARRGRVASRWLEWFEAGENPEEAPEFEDARDLAEWHYMLEIGEVVREMERQGVFDAEPGRG